MVVLFCINTTMSIDAKVSFRMDEDLLLAALGRDDREAMLALFTNPILAIRYRFSAQIPIDDPVLHNKPPLCCAAAYFGAIHCMEGLSENNDRLAGRDDTSLSVMDFAVIGNQLEIVKFLAKVGIGFQDSMFLAAEYGRTEILSFAVSEMEIKPMATRSDGQTILHRAAERGRLETVELISEIPNFDVNASDNDGNTALHLAVEFSRANVVKYLLDLPLIERNPVNLKQESLFHLAARKKTADILGLIFEANGIRKQWDFMTMDYMAADDEIEPHIAEKPCQIDLNQTNSEGMTPLLIAAGDGGLAVVDLLLSSECVNLDCQAPDGRTALHIAIDCNRPEIVKRLIDAGINLDIRDGSGRVPLVMACRKGLSRVVEFLLGQASIDVNAKEGNVAAIHVVAKTGNVEIAKHLLDHPGIDVNAVDANQMTPLMIAVREGHEEMIQLLLQIEGIDKTGIDLEKLTGLHVAARFNQVDVVKSLLATEGVLVNFRDGDGFTPLHIATRNAHEDIVKLLLGHPKCDANAKDSRGKTPLFYAMNQGIRDLLQSNGAV